MRDESGDQIASPSANEVPPTSPPATIAPDTLVGAALPSPGTVKSSITLSVSLSATNAILVESGAQANWRPTSPPATSAPETFPFPDPSARLVKSSKMPFVTWSATYAILEPSGDHAIVNTSPLPASVGLIFVRPPAPLASATYASISSGSSSAPRNARPDEVGDQIKLWTCDSGVAPDTFTRPVPSLPTTNSSARPWTSASIRMPSFVESGDHSYPFTCPPKRIGPETSTRPAPSAPTTNSGLPGSPLRTNASFVESGDHRKSCTCVPGVCGPDTAVIEPVSGSTT